MDAGVREMKVELEFSEAEGSCVRMVAEKLGMSVEEFVRTAAVVETLNVLRMK